MGTWLKRYKTLLIVTGLIVCLAVVLHLLRSGYVLAQYWKEGSVFADSLFEFLSDWALVLSASMMLLLAIVAFMTLVAMNEQRRKSIEPSLQIDDISPVWDRTALTVFDPPLDIDDTTKQYIFRPRLELYVSNTGSGVATGLTVSADVVIDFINEDNKQHNTQYLHFDLLRYAEDQYIRPAVDEPRRFSLTLTHTGSPTSAQKAGSVSLAFGFNDIDGHHFVKIMSYQLPKEKYEIDVNNQDIVPGDSNFVIT